jgi:hypothetical protein
VTRPAHTLADFDPVRSARPAPFRVLGRLDRAIRQAGAQEAALGFGEIRLATYVQPLGRGRHLVTTAAGDTVAVPGAQGSTTYSTGQQVTLGATREGLVILGSPPDGVLGASTFGRDEISGSVDRPVIYSAEPDPLSLPPGTTLITFRGAGFRATPADVLTAVGSYFAGDEDEPPGYPPFAGASIGPVTWVSSEEIEAEVTVTAPVGSRFGVRIDRA